MQAVCRILLLPYLAIIEGIKGVVKKFGIAKIEMTKPVIFSLMSLFSASDEYRGAIREYPMAEQMLMKNNKYISLFIVYLV